MVTPYKVYKIEREEDAKFSNEPGGPVVEEKRQTVVLHAMTRFEGEPPGVFGSGSMRVTLRGEHVGKWEEGDIVHIKVMES